MGQFLHHEAAISKAQILFIFFKLCRYPYWLGSFQFVCRYPTTGVGNLWLASQTWFFW